MNYSDQIKSQYSRVHHAFFLLAPFLFMLISSVNSHAAYAVYADSWGTPTQAQEQATRINRALNITSATYERATVEGRVFWRVRVGYYSTREEANAIRERLSSGGISESWMREVPDSEVPDLQVQPATRPPAPADAPHAESVARPEPDSIALLVDSLRTVSQLQFDEILERIQTQVAGEVVRQLERERTREQQTFVSQMEQAQMTRALLDEMHVNLDALRDSIAEERTERLRMDALRPRIGGAVSVVGDITQQRPEASSITTTANVADPLVRLAVNWEGANTRVALDLRPTQTSGGLTEAHVLWTARQSGTSRSVLGAGRFLPPYGLESYNRDMLLTPAPAMLTTERDLLDGLWIEPYANDEWRFLLLPYGEWDADRPEYHMLGQARYTPARWRFELTGMAGRIESLTEEYEVYSGNAVVEWKNTLNEAGIEVRRTLRDHANGMEEIRTGVLLRVHRQFIPILGWTARGEYLDHSVSPRSRADSYITASATTGPVFTINPRLRILASYTYAMTDTDFANGDSSRDHAHTVHVGFNHAF